MAYAGITKVARGLPMTYIYSNVFTLSMSKVLCGTLP